jgi:hypothetical protein
VLLNCLRQYLRLIALAAAVFLLWSNLDNIPDCPELLNSGSGASAAACAVHHTSISLDRTRAVSGIVPAPVFSNQFVVHTIRVALPCGVIRSLHQAADPSPPSV